MLSASHHFESPYEVASELLRGYSLARSLLHLALQRVEIAGRVLDLGSKTPRVSYYQYLKLAPETEVTFTDLTAAPGVTAVNIEEHFPFEDCSFDTVIAFHLFEHVFRMELAPPEIWRILRPGGRFLVATPFLHEYHADPEDYYRFTDTALRRLHEEAGFRTVSIHALGEGVFTMLGTKLPSLALPPRIRSVAAAAFYLCGTGTDRLLSLRPCVSGRSLPARFALEHFAIFEKPA